MYIDFILPLSITFSMLAWTLVFRWYIHPASKKYSVEQVVKPFLLLHSFRYIGLMFLVPGVTSEVLDTRFAHPAAYGDLAAAMLAFIAIWALRTRLKSALAFVWVFNILGLVDLINAVGRGIMYVPDGHFGAAYWIPATIVPLLLVSHIYLFMLLLKQINKRAFTSSYEALKERAQGSDNVA